ncbi:MAG: PolC-type DNA polymerase III [Ruminococcaceae bacterium]|nr:PolC-type DNA polymerase III [Oscillospiraceae bacterium]
MSQDKNFFTLFARYKPSFEIESILKEATDIVRRLDAERRIVEVTCRFPHLVPKQTVYRIEREIEETYSLGRCILLTRYDASLFTEDYLPQVIEEAKRVRAVTNGFLDDCRISVQGDDITFTIGYGGGSVGLLERAKACETIEGILRAEFGIEKKVHVRMDAGAESYEQYQANMQSRLQDMRKADLARMESERAKAEEAVAKEQAAIEPPKKKVTVVKEDGEAPAVTAGEEEGIFHVGNMTFDTREASYIYGEGKAGQTPTPLAAITGPMRGLYVCGQVNSFDSRANRGETKLIMTIGITDNQSSINVKLVMDKEEGEPLAKMIAKSGRTIRRGVQEVVTVYSMVLAVHGFAKEDKFDGELAITPSAIATIKKIDRMDNAPEKRVELHMHTNLSTMDALIFPEFAVDTAERWGWDCLAVTDHGNAQAYPLMLDYTVKKDIKILYGMEAYYVDDTARAVYGGQNASFDEDEFIVFDIETTGLSVSTCKITEIGAVRVKNGEVLDRFNTFVDPEGHIPEEITRLTGIADEMVKGAPSQLAAVQAFMEFAGERLLIAHNATFDIGFVRRVCEDNKISFPYTFLDTVPLARFVAPELKKYKLDALASHYGLGDFNHHRASDDAEMLAMILFKMVEQLRQEGVHTVAEMTAAMSDKADPLKLKPYHMILFAKNLVGLKNLYKIISMSYLNYFHRVPRVPKTVLDAHREGLIVGSACEAGELYGAILAGNKTADELKAIASYYDYLEIQPLCNNRFLVENGTVSGDEDLRQINRRIVQLGKELGKPVVATCDAHFLNKEDDIYRQILQKGMKFADADRDSGLYLRTTEEMLEEFSYLGEETAYEVVVTNTRKIADSIEKMRPIPDGAFTPKMPGAEEDLQKMCWDRAMNMYGYEGKIPEIVSKRLAKELDSIIKNGFAVLYVIAQKLVGYSESQGYLVGSRGSVGSSFVATMAGISEVNPLLPHYRCPSCRYNEFIEDGSVGSGFDLPDKNCPKCGTKMTQDGHDIPFETFLGFKGDKSPDIDLNFSGEVQGRVHKYTEDLFGSENVFKAGTLGTLASKTAYGYVMKYLDEKGIAVNSAEVNRLVNGCVGVKRTTGQHPGGIVVIPREYDVYDFTPVQHPADDPNSDIVTTHFPFAFLHDTILKLDELGHDIPTKYKWLERFAEQSVMDVPMNDPAVYRLFTSIEPLGIKAGDIDCNVGTYGLPEFGTRFSQKMLEEAQPKCFADLLQISGLSHGTDVWTGNAQDLIKSGTCTISNVIGCRDNIMIDLIRYGMDNLMSFQIMESVRKGKGLKPEWEEAMIASNVPEWYIGSCKKIKYMFPKAHAAAYVMSAIRLGWFKVHKPLVFYSAYFSVAPDGFVADVVMKGRGAVKATMREIDEKIKSKQNSQKDNDILSALQLVDESMARGISYLPVDLHKSDAIRFLPEDGRIRIPFNALDGVGENAALKIVAAREEGEIFSKLELQERAKLPKSVMEILENNNVLRGLSETNQITLF